MRWVRLAAQPFRASALDPVIALAGFADLGLGNGLLNALAAAHGRDDRETAARQASTAVVVLAGVAAALGVAFALVYGRVDWAGVFNVASPVAVAESGPATAALVACLLVGLPLGIVARIRQGYQEGYKTGLPDAAGSVLGLVLVLVAIQSRASLVWLVVAMAGAPVAASLIHALVLFGRDRPWLRVRLGGYDRGTASTLLRYGLMFFALQGAAALMYALDNLIVTQIRGPEAVAQYSVAFKLFSVSLLLADVALVPLWPAYGEAIARGDHSWVRDTLRRSMAVTAIAALVVAALLVLFGNAVISLWVGPEMVASAALFFGLGAWTVVAAVGTAAAMYLNAANRIGVQLVCAAVMIPASLALKVALVRSSGSAGVPWGLVIAYVTFVGLPLGVLAARGRLRPR